MALARSTLSTPTPARPTTFSRPLAASNTSLVTCAQSPPVAPARSVRACMRACMHACAHHDVHLHGAVACPVHGWGMLGLMACA